MSDRDVSLVRKQAFHRRVFGKGLATIKDADYDAHYGRMVMERNSLQPAGRLPSPMAEDI